MKLWWVRVGRLAIARNAYSAIGGWRRLWGRLWWRLALTPRPAVPGPPEPNPERPAALPPPIIHLIIHPENRPMCGASLREPWTEDPATATCIACRRDGDLVAVQFWANTR